MDEWGVPYSSSPNNFTVFNGALYFSAENESGRELWKTDGTESGTVMFKDIYSGTDGGGYVRSSSPHHLTIFNGALYFSAENESGRELLKSDGTESGTVMVKDINPGFMDQILTILMYVTDIYISARG